MPQLKPLLETARENAQRWSVYVETDKDKLTYSRKREIIDTKELVEESDDDSSLDDEGFITVPPSLWKSVFTYLY